MVHWDKPLLRNERPRRTFSSWQIPRSIREGYGITDGDGVDIAFRFGRKSVSGRFHVTSGGELYLPAEIANQVEIYAKNNPRASISFEMEVEPNAVEDIERERPELRNLPETTRQAIIAARIGQGRIRAKLMLKYGRRCAVTGVSVPGLLRASHIKPWRDSDNEERLSADNGLLLVANLTRHLTPNIERQGEILFHRRLGTDPHSVLGITKGAKLTQPPSSRGQYLAQHRCAAGLLRS